jgi:hypothetical protein
MLPYTGVWVRISHRFATRRAEWMASLFAFGFGSQFIFTPDIMDQPQWVIFKSMMPPAYWGIVLLLNGAICLTALTINGASPNVTPKIRMAASALRLFIWAGMLLVFAFGGIVGLWLTLYTVLFSFEWSNLAEASKDVGEAHAAKNAGHIQPSR